MIKKMKKWMLVVFLALNCNFSNSHIIKNSINDLIKYGIKNYENQNFIEAELFLTKAYERSESWIAGFYLGELYSNNQGFPFVDQNNTLALKYFSKATNDLRLLLAQNPGAVNIYLAISLLEKAASINFYPAKYALVNLYINQKKYNLSISLLKDIILNSDNEKYKKLSFIKLHFLGTQKNISEALYALILVSKLKDRAIWLEKLEEKAKTSDNAKLLLAEFWIKQRKYKKASELLELASKTVPNKAIKKLKKLKEKNIAVAILTLGKIYLNQNKLQQAKKHFEAAKKLGCSAAKFHLAQININNSNTESAQNA